MATDIVYVSKHSGKIYPYNSKKNEIDMEIPLEIDLSKYRIIRDKCNNIFDVYEKKPKKIGYGNPLK